MKIAFKIFSTLIVFVMLAVSLTGCLVPDDSSSSADNTPEPTPTFKLMSYNMRIHVLVPGDKRVEYDSAKDRKDLMLKHIADADPDIICVQEWTPVHAEYVGEALEETYDYLEFDRGDLFEQHAIFFKPDRFELVESGQYWLSETPDEPSFSWDASYPRIYAYALLRDKKTDKTIRVGTTHLELNIEALGKQRKMVVDYTAQSQEPAIVCGDFNFDALSKLYLYCINNLNDCRTLCPTATTTASYNGYNLATEKVLDENGNVKDGYGYPIDQIFVKRNAFTVHSYDVLNYLIDGKFSSDHFPVVVELSLN